MRGNAVRSRCFHGAEIFSRGSGKRQTSKASMKILIVTDAWAPQVNGVVRTIQMTIRELEQRGHRVEVLAPDRFRSVPCPSYPEIRLALATRAAVARHVDAAAPDVLHLATEGPLGWQVRAIARRRGWPFTTAYHTRFPEYLRARTPIPLAWSYALLRRFHNAGAATLAATPAIVADLGAHGFAAPRLWSRGVDVALDGSARRECEPDLRIARARHRAEAVRCEHFHAVAALFEFLDRHLDRPDDAVDLRRPRVCHDQDLHRLSGARRLPGSAGEYFHGVKAS